MIGDKLLHYEVTAKLGEGGMGEVYRATDSKLGREVAIKVLPAAFTDDAERLARFEREARVLAALEHPNIAGIYGLEEANGQQLLVMQLASGEDLATHLDRGRLSLEVALPIAAQIAKALEAAHEGGIVHRDLKPANIMVAADRSVKVLDFGLAKAWDGGGSDTNLSASPTLTAQMTQAGVILGTAGYMSPEQARGQEADRRADIWSFGVVLHEMLTGKRLFAADTVSDTLARVLMAEPEWDEIDSNFPAPIARLLHRCLERDVQSRLQAIGEARIAIEGFLAAPDEEVVPTPVPGPAPESSRTSRWLRFGAWAVIGAVAGWITSTALTGSREEAAPMTALSYSIHPPVGSLLASEDINGIDVSRDGGTIAFVAALPDAEPMIYVKKAIEPAATALPGTEGARHPFFSPDGDWLGFFADLELRKIRLQGGSSITISSSQDRRGGVWSPNGTIYFVPDSTGPIMKISESGGEITPVTQLDQERQERTHRWPSLLPDGKGLLYTSDTFASTEYYDDARIEVVDLVTGEHKVLLDGASRAVWSPSGHLLFARDGSLYAAPFDLDALEVTGTAQIAQQGVSTVVASGAVQFAISNDGALVFIPGGKTAAAFDPTWVTEGGESEVVSAGLRRYIQTALSPSEDRALLSTADQEAAALWVYDFERQSVSRLTFDGSSAEPIWTPDGRGVIFNSTRGGTFGRPYWKPADGTGEAELLWDPPRAAFVSDITPEGRYLLVGLEPEQLSNVDGEEPWLVDLTREEEPRKLFDEPIAGSYATISPDGAYIAYSSRVGGSSRIYVRPFPDGAGKWEISTVSSREPRWSPDGKRLYYRTNQGLKYVEIDLTDSFRAGTPKFFESRSMGPPFNMTYDIAKDGRILSLRPVVEGSEVTAIHVLQGWTDELSRRLRPAQ